MSRFRATTLAALYGESAGKFGRYPFLAAKDKEGKYQTVSYQDVYARGLAVATALIELGLQPKEKVGLLADNRPEWILADLGILLAGCADVPRGTDITEKEVAYILNHADVRFLFVENLATLGKYEAARAQIPGVERVILLDPKAAAPEGVLKLEELMARGAELRAEGDRKAEERIAGVQPEDLFTIIYTSGTTGTPKGVQLTNANMVSQARNLPFDFLPGDRSLAILPIWHSYERVFEVLAMSMGVCNYYTSLRHIAEDLKTVRPSVMCSAPRLWENLYQKLMSRMEGAPALQKGLFNVAQYSTRRVKRAERFFKGQQLDLTGRSLPESAGLAVGHAARWVTLVIPHAILDKVVMAKLREAVGCGDFRGTISGGGALQPHVDEFFNSIGIPVLEGYGLTETCPVLAVRTWKNLVIGTVGPLYPETEIRIVDLSNGEILYPNSRQKANGRGLRGEIHAKGPQVMKGYYKDPETTARVMKDGWFNTGDIGMVTFNDCLKILGRSKDTIVLLNGENVEPVPIENKLSHSPLIDQCIVVGQDQKQLGALIVPSREGFREAGVQAASIAELAANEQAKKLLEEEIRKIVNGENGFKSFERIGDFRMLAKPFEVGEEMTATYKLKRHVITDRYPALMAELYPDPLKK
ncbi:long-chain fatty acid--CoA ligase [soil metagenome]